MQWKNSDCPLLSSDIYIYSSWDTGTAYDRQLLSGKQKPGVIYCSALNGKKGESSSITALTGASLEDTILLEKMRATKNSEYLSAKKQIADLILGELKNSGRKWRVR